MRRAPAATPRMRPELRPKKLTRRSASPSGKVFKMMASVSRAGMKCRRVRLGRGAQRVSGQAGRTCRSKLNNIEEEAEQCARGRDVEEVASDRRPVGSEESGRPEAGARWTLGKEDERRVYDSNGIPFWENRSNNLQVKL